VKVYLLLYTPVLACSSIAGASCCYDCCIYRKCRCKQIKRLMYLWLPFISIRGALMEKKMLVTRPNCWCR